MRSAAAILRLLPLVAAGDDEGLGVSLTDVKAHLAELRVDIDLEPLP